MYFFNSNYCFIVQKQKLEKLNEKGFLAPPKYCIFRNVRAKRNLKLKVTKPKQILLQLQMTFSINGEKNQTEIYYPVHCSRQWRKHHI